MVVEIYVVGQDGLKKAIQQAGFVCSGGSDDNQHLEWSDIAQLEDNKQVANSLPVVLNKGRIGQGCSGRRG